MKCLMQTLVEDLGHCCIWNFMRAARPYSARKLSLALGVHPNTVKYWRDKYLIKEIRPCRPACRHLDTQIELSRTASGRIYFARSDSR